MAQLTASPRPAYLIPKIFENKASIYALNEETNEWQNRGVSGTMSLYQTFPDHLMNANPTEIKIKWTKNEQEIWWILDKFELKRKGQRAVVLKAYAQKQDRSEILAIRFRDLPTTEQFIDVYANLSIATAQSTIKCNFCGNTNQCERGIQYCDICGMFPIAVATIDKIYSDSNSMNYWECESCTFKNSFTQETCRICSFPYQTYIDRFNLRAKCIDLKQRMVTKQIETKDIIRGYCRESESVLRINNVIPDEVIELCFSYYVNSPWDFVFDIIFEKLFDSATIKQLLENLHQIVAYLLNGDSKYRILSLNNPNCQQKILNYNGTLTFLYHLGFTLNDLNNKLIYSSVDQDKRILFSCIESIKHRYIFQ